MNKTIGFALMISAIAFVGLAATAIMSPMSAHADQPQYCYNDGGNKVCFSSKEQCEKAATHDQQCKKNRA